MQRITGMAIINRHQCSRNVQLLLGGMIARYQAAKCFTCHVQVVGSQRFMNTFPSASANLT